MAFKSGETIVILPGAYGSWAARFRRSQSGVNLVQSAQTKGDFGHDRDAAIEALRGLISEIGGVNAPVYSILSRYDITTRIVELPSNDPDEIESMLKLSSSEYVPYSEDDVVVGHAILHNDSVGDSRVLAAFAHRDRVEGHIDLLKKAGAAPDRVLLSTGAIASAAIAAPYPDSPERYTLACLGMDGIEALTFGPKGLDHIRAVSSNTRWDLSGAEADQVTEEFGIELRSSLSAYRRASADGLGSEACYIACDSGDPKRLCDSVAHDITVPCEAEPFSRALGAGNPDEPLPLSLIGAAIAADERAPIVLTLTPPSMASAHQRAQQREGVRTIAIAAVVILASITLVYGHAIWQRMAYLSDLETRLDAIRVEAEESIEKQRQLMIIRSQVEQRASGLELLAEITKRAPSGMNIVRYKYDESEGITIQGRAFSEGSPARLAQTLRELGADEYPEFLESQSFGWRPVQEYDKTVYEFTIESPFPGGEDGEPSEE